MAEIKAGSEVESNCTRCKLTLAHTVIAIWQGQIKRVRCNTCMGEHAYHPPAATKSARSTKSAGSSDSTKPARAKSAKKKAPVSRAAMRAAANFTELLAGRDRSVAKRYSIQTLFSARELIAHPSFGLGVVSELRDGGKIDVCFEEGMKTLLHGRGAAPDQGELPQKRSDIG